ncbi:DUF393 domain-containing protein [Georgenia yuyongxinii]|uniref:DUF393 domain-containing protein n=1 Tax=Georgenia yuyongxinii TaxID=2589797 RepID=A0A5B8BZT2_9MICO|nr:DCC1-like thiol-disulfide oxidoreductase family protein [Georgenia yuyongxinii]QDC23929.1 DUF393 domain-containing protein [Georgenia yuyongxinii]
MSVTARIDSWIHGGAFTRASLARYRVVYAAIALLTLPDFSWPALFPDSMYIAPPGPFMLSPGFPPEVVLRGLEALFAACLVAILLGWFTRTASVLAVIVAMTGFGFTYSLGKIDHDILLVLLPAPMALAGWGDRFSLDAVRRRARGLPAAAERADQWPLRLYALMIGLGFLTAAWPKIRGDWLNPRTQAVQGHQVRQYFTNDKDDLLAPFFLEFDHPVFWEILDIATILLEAGLILAVLSWTTTRFAFAVAGTFHLGVWLMMNIAFFMNVVAYGFLVPWDRLPVPRALRRSFAAPAWLVRLAPVLVIAGGVSWSLLVESVGNAAGVVYPVVLVVGGLVGAWFLLAPVVRLGQAARAVHRGADPSGRLLYDADCGFCTRSALWLARRRPDRVTIVPWQSVPDLAEFGLREEDLRRQAYWQGTAGPLRGGSAAIAAAMVARGGPAVLPGLLIPSGPVRPMADLVYRAVASRRHLMPGGTDACALTPARVADEETVAPESAPPEQSPYRRA